MNTSLLAWNRKPVLPGGETITIRSNNFLIHCKVPRGGWGRQSEGRAQQQWLWDVPLTDHGREINEFESPGVEQEACSARRKVKSLLTA